MIQPALRVLLLACATTVLTVDATSQGTPIGFLEDFALAEDRSAALRQLVPGTQEHYFYRCLERQHAGALGEVDRLLAAWIQRHGRGALVQQIERRQYLLKYSDDPEATRQWLIRQLGVDLSHQRELPGAAPDLPTRLDPAQLAPDALLRRALERHPRSLDGIRTDSLRRVAGVDLDETRRAQLLERLEYPDFPNLVELVVADLARPGSFGSRPVHQRLTLDQLQRAAERIPELLEVEAFVDVWLRRLVPGPDVPWRDDPRARERYLDRLWNFAQRLAPTFNTLKAHILYHRLVHDLAAGRVDRARLVTYLQLPRPFGYVAQSLRRAPREARVDLGKQWPTGLDPLREDEDVVRQSLMRSLVDADGYDTWTRYVDEEWLRRLFVETKLLYGVGEPERWVRLVDAPGWVEELRERVEIRFPPTRDERFAVGDPVSIEVHVKNVDSLLVKVFEIDTFNYCRGEGKEVDASIELDGLVPNEERREAIDADPLRRVARRFDFPSMQGPGVWIVEFLGNGIASRAVVRKGGLRAVQRHGAAGHVFTVHDLDGRRLPEASIWLGGRSFTADRVGEIVIPYSTEAGSKQVILRHAGLATIHRFRHAKEEYDLRASVHVEREALLAGNQAAVVIRPVLRLAGVVIDPSVLETSELQIRATDRRGSVSNLDTRDLQIGDRSELIATIRVPDELRRLEVTLRGSVSSLTTGDNVRLASAPKVFEVNGIDVTDRVGAPLLTRTPGGYVLDLLGKDGEPLAGRSVRLRLTLVDFTDPLDVELRTDDGGRVVLGPLDGVRGIGLLEPSLDEAGWDLTAVGRADLPHALTVAAGETVRIAVPAGVTIDGRDDVALFEVRLGQPLRDAYDAVAVDGRFLVLRGLEAGDYQLVLRRLGQTTAVSIVQGERRGRLVAGAGRWAVADRNEPLQITGLSRDGERLRIAVANATEATRVHVVASRYAPPFPWFPDHARHAWEREPDVGPPAFHDTTYAVGRALSDEYRYILERREARKFPGNMLERPGVLLNPWALERTDTMLGLGGGAGGAYGGRGARRGGSANAGPSTLQRGAYQLHPNAWADLAFLPKAAEVIANVAVDADGIASVSIADLGPGRHVHVVALAADGRIARGELVLPPTELQPEPVHLVRGLDPAQDYAEQRGIEFVESGGTARVLDPRSAEIGTLDSLAAVHALFRGLTGNAALAEFEFVTRWNTLEAERKLQLYSEHACHELHLFLHEKDPGFFAGVVRPYLENKADKTFVDHWLLEDDLSGYLDPWRFGRLNVVEKILLARRAGADGEGIVQLIADAVALLPPDPAAQAEAFFGVLAADKLDAQQGGLAAKLGELRDELQSQDLRRVRERLRRNDRDAGRPEAARAAAPGAPAEAPAPEPSLDAVAQADDDEEVSEPEEFEAGAEIEGPDDAKRREQVRAFYRGPEPTQRYVESNYWHVPIEESNAELVEADPFWLDFAQHGDGPFVSTQVTHAAGNFTEMLLALAFLDLPFEAGEHASEVAEGQLTMTAASPLLLVKKELGLAEKAADVTSVLVSQNFFRLDTRYVVVDGQQQDAWVSEEFVAGVPYGCQVVVTNPTSTARDLEILLQVPEGAIPVQDSFLTRSVAQRLAPYSTQAIGYAFYFPRPGAYRHYPVHVSVDDKVVAEADAINFNAVAEPSVVDRSSWRWIAHQAEPPQVLEYLAQQNLLAVDLGQIAWRMRDGEFFGQALERLRARRVYAGPLWGYGFRHGDERAIREYLRHADGFLRSVGPALVSPLLVVDPVQRHWYQHVEYRPLIHPRAHRFGRQHRILNSDLAQQYLSFLSVLAHRPQLDSDDWMDATYYLLLQDRVAEAMAAFAKVDPQQVPMRLQYDAMQAYLAFYRADVATARRIAEQHRDHPIAHWRERFREMIAHLEEAEGRVPQAADGDSVDLAASEPSLELDVEGRTVKLRFANLNSVEVRYYRMDVEFLFSNQPFVEQDSDAFAYVMPNRLDRRTLDEQANSVEFALPDEFAGQNVLVEVRGAGVVRREPIYANAMAVRWVESQGQVIVGDAESGRPLPQVYVKVYGRLPNGGVRFHKDGYTDLRGRFDYVSISGEGGMAAERYAVLVFSDERGAVIREVAAPTR